jgi:hypothetical protein
MHLTELADDQHMISPGEWLDFLTLPKFPVALLPDVLEAVGKRLQGIEGPLPGRQGRRRGAPCVERVAPEQVVESRFLRLWQALVPNPITAVALSAMVRERVPMVSGDGQPRYPELQEAAIQMMGDLSQWDVRELGYRLRAVAGRIHDGRRVVKTPKGRAGVSWVVESVL